MGFDQDHIILPPGMSSLMDGEHLLCPICTCVLEDPSMVVGCEHTFCGGCINEALKRSIHCPICRRSITKDSLKPPPRLLRNLLDSLQITCSFEGCMIPAMPLTSLRDHEKSCKANPDRLSPCLKGCRGFVRRGDKATHNCVAVMGEEIDQLRYIMTNLFQITNLQSFVMSHKVPNLALVEERHYSGKFGANGFAWKLAYEPKEVEGKTWLALYIFCCGPLTTPPSDKWSITIHDTIQLKLKAHRDGVKDKELGLTNKTFKCKPDRVDESKGQGSVIMEWEQVLRPSAGYLSPEDGSITFGVVFPPRARVTTTV